jgi:hypothetical protein
MYGFLEVIDIRGGWNRHGAILCKGGKTEKDEPGRAD